jgi:Phage-related lysozyme (muraminidase)
MKISKQGLDFIKEFESFSSIPYVCAGGKLTIGYGHVVLKNENYITITEERGLILLEKDVEVREGYINSLVKVKLSQNQYDALLSFIFNVGNEAFKNSTLLRKLNAGDYIGSADEFTRWNKAGGEVVLGLVRRRNSEKMMFLKED